MSWATIIKKNTKKVETKKKPVVKKIIELNDDFYDEDQYFNDKYDDTLYDIELEFKKFINNNSKKKIFLNKYNFEYTLDDFIRNNCEEYYNIIDEVEELNKEELEYTSDDDIV